MRKLLIPLLLLWAGISNAATAFEPYVIRNERRSAEETVRQLEASPHLWEFQQELQANTGFHFGNLTKAAEDGVLVTRRCDDCFLETAGLRGGKTVYHRHVETDELVAYLNGVPLFLPACGNPVRPMNRRAPEPPALPPVAPTPVATPPPVQPPTPPVAETPRRPREVCSPDQVSYTTEVTILPGTNIGPWFGWWAPDYFSPGSISMTTSHHDWECVQEMSPEPQIKTEESR